MTEFIFSCYIHHTHTHTVIAKSSSFGLSTINDNDHYYHHKIEKKHTTFKWKAILLISTTISKNRKNKCQMQLLFININDDYQIEKKV